jgi:hypothetical protein
MHPPPQLVQWLKQNYPKPSVDEESDISAPFYDAPTSSLELASTMLRLDNRGA